VLADGIINGDMEGELKKILDGMIGEEKIHVLGYFESIIQNSEIANYLFKSNFISYYLKLLKGYRLPSLRAKMCEILGLLIRHATSIEPDILKFGIINGFL
jgi:serine/threonine-protein kinase ULK4